MYKSDTSATASSGGGTREECCTDAACKSGQRNNYFEGKRLTPDSFRVEQRYLVDRRHLINRALFGWGVVYGYKVEATGVLEGRNDPTFRSLDIDSGLALDACGRELVQVGKTCVSIDDLIVVNDKGRRLTKEERNNAFRVQRACWRLEAHYAERSTDPVTVTDACRCDHDEWDRVCETVRYTLRLVDCAECCADPPCTLVCACGRCCEPRSKASVPTKKDEPRHLPDAGQILHPPGALGAAQVLHTDEVLRTEERPHAVQAPKVPEHGVEIVRHPPAHPPRRGGCRCLCDHLTKPDIDVECSCKLQEVDECCGHVRADLGHGVPLACVEVSWDERCKGWVFTGPIEDCGPRRLVKRNDLLFDLIRGCDLTRISEIGWGPWHRKEVDFQDFSAGFGDIGKKQSRYVTRRFSVTFAGPVRVDTLGADCFTMRVLFDEGEGGWSWTRRVPILDVQTEATKTGDPAGHTRKAWIVVDGPWADDAVCGTRHLFQRGSATVEIEIRGDYIIDCTGQAVDANGDGAPGGTFVSSFRVRREAPSAEQAPYDQRPQGAK